jgi:hypothetical protein
MLPSVVFFGKTAPCTIFAIPIFTLILLLARISHKLAFGGCGGITQAEGGGLLLWRQLLLVLFVLTGA